MPFTIGGEWTPNPFQASAKLPIKVTKEKRRGAYVTLILNIGQHHSDLKKLCSSLKQRFGCGGSIKKETIELQGDQLENVKTYLKDLGLKIK